MKTVLYGICGIGRGHTYRQLPIVEKLAESCRLVVFAYGESLNFYTERFAENENVTVAAVAVPFYVGNATGLDFEATAVHPANKQDFTKINTVALAVAERILGVPDLVISDYEPVAAQYAYATGAPLVTLDQQSKYLSGEFPALLEGCGYADEIARLGMFFPKVTARLACSFFVVSPLAGRPEVQIVPPILRDAIVTMQRMPAVGRPQILVYLSPQECTPARTAEIVEILGGYAGADFHVFAPQTKNFEAANVWFYRAGDAAFNELLATCNGIVATAGHTLLSEAMALGIPVFALPLPLYEQLMNGHVVAKHGFGMAERLMPEALARFVDNLPVFAKAIAADKDVLVRGDGLAAMMAVVKEILG